MLIALTLGDPAGVGPEVVAKTWGSTALHELCRPLVVGHPEIVRRALSLVNSPAKVVEIAQPRQAQPAADVVPVLPTGKDDQLKAPPGQIDARSGEAAYVCVVRAAKLALAGEVAAITTGPLHKEALHASGHFYPGHTELLAELCGEKEVAMMLYLEPGPHVLGPAGLGVVHATLHMSVRNALAALSTERIGEAIMLADTMLTRLKGSPPNIGVAALNPHAGEGGLFGDEERTLIRPAVEAAQAAGLQVHGPLPVDTLMVRARDGEFDVVVAMYHDQGHIALKLLGMHEAVNVTCGLPIVRTSVAHGTAFDRAWQGTAETSGLISSVRVAAKLAG